MSAFINRVTGWAGDVWQAWNRFWFTPSAPHTLALLRIFCGCMLFYTHFVWGINLLAFLGPDSWIPPEAIREIESDSYAWSYLWYIQSPALLWAVHLIALGIFSAFTVGLYTRVTSVLSALITLAYCHRLQGALFGLDQINAMLAMYLAVGPCGAVYSIDQWMRQRRSEPAITPSLSSNIATRLIQLHMCVIYLFGGIGKMRGELWWDGSALWFALANYEYQSFDLTGLVHYPFVIAFLTHITVFWETFYPFLVWSKITRPVALAMAVLVHAGIALFLGMPTFGIAMIFGNLAFVAPDTVASFISAVTRSLRSQSQLHSPRPANLRFARLSS